MTKSKTMKNIWQRMLPHVGKKDVVTIDSWGAGRDSTIAISLRDEAKLGSKDPINVFITVPDVGDGERRSWAGQAHAFCARMGATPDETLTITYEGELHFNGDPDHAMCPVSPERVAKSGATRVSPQGVGTYIPSGVLAQCEDMLPILTKDDTRASIYALYVDTDKQSVVATDGARIEVQRMVGRVDGHAERGGVRIPPAALAVMGVDVGIDTVTGYDARDPKATHATVSLSRGGLVVQYPHAQYPDWERVVPTILPVGSAREAFSFTIKGVAEFLRWLRSSSSKLGGGIPHLALYFHLQGEFAGKQAVAYHWNGRGFELHTPEDQRFALHVRSAHGLGELRRMGTGEVVPVVYRSIVDPRYFTTLLKRCAVDDEVHVSTTVDLSDMDDYIPTVRAPLSVHNVRGKRHVLMPMGARDVSWHTFWGTSPDITTEGDNA